MPPNSPIKLAMSPSPPLRDVGSFNMASALPQKWGCSPSCPSPFQRDVGSLVLLNRGSREGGRWGGSRGEIEEGWDDKEGRGAGGGARLAGGRGGRGEMSRRTSKMTRRWRSKAMRRRVMNPPNEDQCQQIEPNTGDWTTTMQDEWAQKWQVVPNGDICEGRRVRECGYNDSHPAPDETTITSPSMIDWDTDSDGKGEKGQPQGRQAWYNKWGLMSMNRTQANMKRQGRRVGSNTKRQRRRVATQPNMRRTRAAQPNARREEEECGKTWWGVRTNMMTVATAAQQWHNNDN